MNPITFFRRFALAVKAVEDAPEVVYVYPAANITVTPTLRIFGGEGVTTFVDGTRGEAPRENRYHVDVTVEWPETGDAAWMQLAPMLRDLAGLGPESQKVFFPSANRDGLPLGQGVPVVIDFKESEWPTLFQDNIRTRKARLVLRSSRLIAGDYLPPWLFR